jgi:penicillin-binding protein 1A
MGIKSDLRAYDEKGRPLEFSLKGADFSGYPPSMILGSQVVTPLEMAHAYNTIEEDGDRVSGTMAASKGGPVAIAGVFDGDPSDDSTEPVEDKDGNSGINESTREQVLKPETAATAVSTLTSVVTSGTGKRAQTGEPTWGKTGTTDDNGDAWFCGATPDITACVWVGHADSRDPMLTEFAGAPVDGGTIPALIFADVVNAYLSVFEDEETTTTPVVPETTVPTTPVVPETPVVPDEPVVPEEEVLPEEQPPTEDTGGVAERGRGRSDR